MGLALATLAVLAACAEDEARRRWTLLESERPGALVSVWGAAPDDVWIVGGDRGDGLGPTVLRFDGERSTLLDTGVARGDLWWATGTEQGTVYMGGADGLILRYEGGAFERMSTPGTGTVFGLWAAAADDVWAVGGEGASAAFVWRLRGDAWQPAEGLPASLSAELALRKVWGTGPSDVWLVGTQGTTIHHDGHAFEVIAAPKRSELFTVHAAGVRVAAVGGVGSGVLFEWDGAAWRDATPPRAPELVGVWLEGERGGFAVGGLGAVYERDDAGWSAQDHGLPIDEDLHSVWSDGQGCVLAAGGRWRAYPLTRGVLIRGCR